ncbi:DUF6892 domain-containing protein [Flagellimonas olearia]|uniref:DUF6892 domain-containing protein n=1 Tax=Flagellimonas olearia TaxID=552546 RepID=A0A444VNT0_9FLAO|nr:hypothetical protein [Allomuricauda olearia]RYC52467.1 hypothetical protein DN53_11390 [Allomuricauda olearia]
MDKNLEKAIIQELKQFNYKGDIPMDVNEKIGGKWGNGELIWDYNHLPYSFYDIDKYPGYFQRNTERLIRSLDGIDCQKELRILNIPLSKVDDLAILSQFNNLEGLAIGISALCSLDPTLEMKSLKRLFVHGEISDKNMSVIWELRENNVTVDLMDDLEFNLENWAKPFSDMNVKLAVLDKLSNEDKIELPKLFYFSEYCFDVFNLKRVLQVDIEKQLDIIESLEWEGGGRNIQHCVYPQWDGEDDTFNIRSLEGLEKLGRLKKFNIDSCANEDFQIPDKYRTIVK